MKQLAIKGHKTRGKEVIELLRTLGGNNPFSDNGTVIGTKENYCYYISKDTTKYISWDYIGPEEIDKYIIFTLEEFFEKYPYKLGDKVEWINDNKTWEVESVEWKEEKEQVLYTIGTDDVNAYVYINELRPYEEKTMEEKDTAKAPKLIGQDYSGKRFGYKLPDGYEFDCIENNEIILKPIKSNYPKTYKECCDVIGCDSKMVLGTMPLQYNILVKLEKLLICRDAYWRLAGEQMGLGKSWEPDYTEESWEQRSPIKYVIYYTGTNITKERKSTPSYVLAFPTEEIRDIFYNNFKELIEKCKELL